jgi:PPM family protein phosphatase
MNSAKSLPIECAARSSTGRRSNNEDAWCADADLGLFMVADGMGGYEGGEVASNLAVKAMHGFYARNRRDDNLTWPFGIDPKLGLRENMLAVAIRMADAEILSQKKGRLASMGSTVAAVAVHDATAVVGHVGDSRVYRLRDGALTQLTRDHSLYEEMRAIGAAVPPRERFPHANVITRALGMLTKQGPEVIAEVLREGDALLLCTDGLTEAVTEARIAEVLGAMGAVDACDTLVKEAFDNGGRDNITAVVVRVA